jgi:DNA-binding transcriptional LysR family regulator
MDLRWLDDVLVLLEEGNMTRAAARRNITQPAFSRRIRGFEDWIGAKLLDRQPNSVGISPALSDNEAEIRALLARLRDLRGRIRHHDPSRATLAIAAQHAPVFSILPDMALHARQRFPALKFRLRAANLRDCVSMFLRGDAQILLCYESSHARPMPFGEEIRRVVWGKDYLVPVIGGALRYRVRDDGTVPEDTPAIVYPEGSYFGEVLQASERAFATEALSRTPLFETALSGGIKQLVLAGLGVGWLPYSMVYGEVESGDLISLANAFGQEPLETAVYADMRHGTARAVLETWSRETR